MQAEGGRAVSEHEDRGVLQQYCKPCLTQTTPFRPLIICNSNSAHTTTAGQQERRACGAYKSNHQYVPFPIIHACTAPPNIANNYFVSIYTA